MKDVPDGFGFCKVAAIQTSTLQKSLTIFFIACVPKMPYNVRQVLPDDIINPVTGIKHRSYDVTSEGRIVIYPSLYETGEKSKLRRILKRLIHIKKGH